jgi:hypothetical protein
LRLTLLLIVLEAQRQEQLFQWGTLYLTASGAE